MRQDVSCKQGTAPHMGNIRKHMCDDTLLIKPELMDPTFTSSRYVLLDFLHFICCCLFVLFFLHQLPSHRFRIKMVQFGKTEDKPDFGTENSLNVLMYALICECGLTMRATTRDASIMIFQLTNRTLEYDVICLSVCLYVCLSFTYVSNQYKNTFSQKNSND